MAKVIKFPTPDPSPEKFGLQRVQSKKDVTAEKRQGQLNLFVGGKVVRMHQLTHFDEALLHDDQGDKKTARKHYYKSIEQGEFIADSYCNLGILESHEGNTSKAIDCFTKSLRYEPRHFESHYNLANLYADVGNYNLARIHYEVSIEMEPTFPNSYFNLGLVLAMSKQFKDAVKALHRYKDMTPSEEHNYTNDLIEKLNSAG
jgi:tetratricopeptide (TPR) repeat protein